MFCIIKISRSVSQVRFIYVLTTIFMVGLSIFSFVQINNLFKSSNQIYHTNQVKNALRNISSSLLEAETSKRGFLLTRDSLMLIKRDNALRALALAQYNLDSLISDNEEQKQHTIKLYQAIDEKEESIRKTLADGTLPDVPLNLRRNINDGIKRMDNVHENLNAMIREESLLLERRTQIFTRLSLIAPLYIIVLFLGALLILFYSYFELNKELVISHNLHTDLNRQREDTEILTNKLILANQELAFQNEEKENRATELAVANEELASQNQTKEKLAGELIIANQELAFQNEEKEKRATELLAANTTLELFLNISSHDLQEPLRKIQMAASRIDSGDYMALSSKGRDHFLKMQQAAISMQTLIEDLLMYSRMNAKERKFENIDLNIIVNEVRNELKETIEIKNATIEVTELCEANIIHFQFRQLIHNIISNALKFSITGQPPHILISGVLQKGSDCNQTKLMPDQEYCHIRIADNGIGFEPEYNEKIFEVFQRLYGKETYKGSGIGLAIVKRIVENHDGIILATGQLNKGATFDLYIPTIKRPQHG